MCGCGSLRLSPLPWQTPRLLPPLHGRGGLRTEDKISSQPPLHIRSLDKCVAGFDSVHFWLGGRRASISLHGLGWA